MPDFTNVPNFNIRYKAPNTESLNSLFRNNLYECMDAMPLFVMSGQERRRVGGAWWPLTEVNPATVAAASNRIILFPRIKVPSGITNIAFNILAAVDFPETNYIRIYMNVAPGVFYDYTSLPGLAGITWLGWQNISVASGWDDFVVDAYNTNGAFQRLFYLHGVLVIPLR